MKYLIIGIVFSSSYSWAFLPKDCRKKIYENAVFEKTGEGKTLSDEMETACDRIVKLLAKYDKVLETCDTEAKTNSCSDQYQALVPEQTESLAEYGKTQDKVREYLKTHPLIKD